MNLIEKIDLLEDELYLLEKEAAAKRKELRKLSHCIRRSHDHIQYVKLLLNKDVSTTINNIGKIWFNSEKIKLDIPNYSVYVDVKSLWDEIKPNDTYDKAKFIKDLKALGIAVSDGKSYYKSQRVSGESRKLLRLDYKILHNLLKAD